MAESMPALAQEFAQICKGKGIALDFLPRTLPLVDRYMLSAKGADGDEFMKTAGMITAYVGEVIRRETGGAWREFDGTPMVEVGSHLADPMLAVMQLLDSGRADIGDASFTAPSRTVTGPAGTSANGSTPPSSDRIRRWPTCARR